MALPMESNLDPAQRTARVIKALLGASGLEQKDLAAGIGWQPPTLTKALKGQRQWKATELERVAKFFNIGVGTLFMDPDELMNLLRTGSSLRGVDMPDGQMTLDLRDDDSPRVLALTG
jgi:transcriptional regulator with XRE-family HTH domain